MMATKTIACKLPHGPVLEIDFNRKNQTPGKNYSYVVLNGLNKALAGAKFGVTVVDAALWDTWARENKDLRYLKDGSIYDTAIGPPAQVPVKAVPPRVSIVKAPRGRVKR